MNKAYTRINFQNAPSTATPLNATNLNKIDKAINDIDNRVIELAGYQEEAQEAAEQASSSASAASKAAETAASDAEARVNEVIKGLEVYTKEEAHKQFASIIKQVATGSPILITDGMDVGVLDFKAYGRSTQNGTPAPNNLVEIVNIAKDGILKVTSTGKNLIPYPYQHTTRTYGGTTITDNGDGSLTANGTGNANHWFSLWSTFCLPKGRYVLSGCPSGGSASNYRIILRKNADNNDRTAEDYGTGKTFEVTDDTVEYTMMIGIINGATVTDLVFKPMLRRVEVTDATYELYKSSNISIPLSEPLRSVGEVKDEIAWVDGVYGVIRRIGEVCYDGSDDENWTYQARTSTNRKFILIDDMKPEMSVAICNRYTYLQTDEDGKFFTYTNSKVHFCDAIDVRPSVKDWKAWLQSNNITVQYILAEESFEPFDNQALFDNIVTYDNVTYITATDNAEMEVTYATDTKSYIDSKFAELHTAIVNML